MTYEPFSRTVQGYTAEELEPETFECECCKQTGVGLLNSENVCEDCETYYKQCDNCDNWFHIDDLEHELCENCLKSYRIENDMESTYESLNQL